MARQNRDHRHRRTMRDPFPPGGHASGLPRGRSVPWAAAARNGGGAAIFRRPGESLEISIMLSNSGALQREAK
jgi:hypothetical protein